MRLLLPLLFALTSLAQADRLVSWQRRLNLTLLEYQHGAGEIEIVNGSTFRFVRCRIKPCAGRAAATDPVDFRATDTQQAFEFRTSYLEIRVRKHDGGLMVKSRHGVEMLDEIVPPAPAPTGVYFSRRAPEGERLYGLGPRTDSSLDLRGKQIATKRPLLISTLGYGLWFTATSDYTFDLASSARGRVTIRAAYPDRLEFYFHYGPGPKEILEENHAVNGWSFVPTLADTTALLEPALPRYATKVSPMPFSDLLAWLAHASMSAVMAPAIDQSSLPPKVAPLFPLLFGGSASPERRSFTPYLFTYLIEANDRGFPLFRPMAMQYPKDATAAPLLDQFMLGDELLVGTGNNLYLPQGIWTDMRTNTIHTGRQTIPVADAPGMPVFAKNGTIVPLLRPDRTIELHYFPRLGAEFFIAEPGEVQPSQVHAGPAAGVLRLEIESRVDRNYEWVVHHVSPAESIEPSNDKSRYDSERKILRIPIAAKARGDSIVNVKLEMPLEP